MVTISCIERAVSRETPAAVACFTAGARIATPQGPVAVEDLEPGDVVLTRDSGHRVLRWTGRCDLSAEDLARNPELCPVRIAPGALGAGLPERELTVSPQHRMLVTADAADALFGAREVLVAALLLVGRPGITRLGPADLPRGISYVHVMCDRHEILLADGAWSESYQPGDRTMAAMDAAQRRELLAIFPELARPEGRAAYEAARRSLSPAEARALFDDGGSSGAAARAA